MISVFKILDPGWYGFKKLIENQKNNQLLVDEQGGYKVSLVYRGQYLLYSDATGSICIEINLGGHPKISPDAIKKWGYSTRLVTSREKAVIFERLDKFIQNLH